MWSAEFLIMNYELCIMNHSDHLGSLSHSSYFSAKNKRSVNALIDSIVTHILGLGVVFVFSKYINFSVFNS